MLFHIVFRILEASLVTGRVTWSLDDYVYFWST